MKVTFNWLKQYVAFDWTPEELAVRLTMLGLEVESMQKLGGQFEGVVVAQVLTRDKHPNADKLSVCRVNDGTGERLIVCGAQNFQAGDKVPLILPGHALPSKPGEPPMTIKVGKIRGVESQGMLCSPDELGLPDKIEGLLILRPEATVGQPFAQYVGGQESDVVYDLEITPNRPDWNSVIGIAREIGALNGQPLRRPEISIAPAQLAGEPAEKVLAVRIQEPELCRRYTARLIRGVKVAPSPAWLRSTLEKAGLRSINNVVDVTNFVMLETGQPLHAFDYHLLDGQPPAIVVRRPAEGEKFVTLDGQERALTDKMLLIADETKAVALAGIMGGRNSEIQSTTVDVLLESAWFEPRNIRATSKKLDLRTDSSYRFERGADLEICEWASRRAAQLILQTAGGLLMEPPIDNFPAPSSCATITLRCEKTKELLGVDIAPDAQIQFLRRLGLECLDSAAPPPSFRVPSFRVDLKREADLIEEIARLYGVDKIPATPPRGAIGTNVFDIVHDQLAEARRVLTALGLFEAQGQTLISEVEALKTTEAKIALLSNPLSADMNALRPSLMPGLVAALRYNVSRKTGDVALFEVGRVFVQAEGKIKEERRLGFAMTGRRQPGYWSGVDRDAKCDIYDLKGAVEEFLDQFGLRGVSWTKRNQSPAFFLESAVMQLGKIPLGEIGQLSPQQARLYDLRDAVFLAELNLDVVLARRVPGRSFKPLPSYPAIRRDVAMLVAEETLFDAVRNVVKQTKPPNLETMEVFDVFRGQNVPDGRKSIACAFTYRHAERTLTDAEVNAAHEKLVGQLRVNLHATIRDAGTA